MKLNNLYTLGGISALSILGACSTAKEEKPLNIIYIMTDDHTQQAMGCYGYDYANTPNLDRIANEGVIFTNSYVANSLSGPSRACMLTGKHSHANGFTNNIDSYFDGSQQTFPKLLQNAGLQLLENGIYIQFLQDLTIGRYLTDKENILILNL